MFLSISQYSLLQLLKMKSLRQAQTDNGIIFNIIVLLLRWPKLN